MKKFILLFALSCPCGLMCAIGTMDRLRMILLDDLDKAEYYLDTYPNLSHEQKDQVWVWIRNGCRKTLAHYSAIERKYGDPSPQNAIDIISDQIEVKMKWARVFNKAVASGIRPVLDNDLCNQYERHRAYQEQVTDRARTDYVPLDPE